MNISATPKLAASAESLVEQCEKLSIIIQQTNLTAARGEKAINELKAFVVDPLCDL